jgi:hypothetical protein
VLRITRHTKDGTVWLKLEGKLAGPWVNVCGSACASEVSAGRRPALDLADVTFVDRDGLHLLRQLAEEGLAMPVRSNYVAELLRLEKP